MEKIINTLINSSVQGVDTYNHNGSTWLIFTESKQWVIELTESKTLWYNFNFFRNTFAYASLEVVQNQHLITKWVEDNVINKVEKTRMAYIKTDWSVEDTIQNGIKHTTWGTEMNDLFVDDALENGVMETRLEQNITEGEIDDIIQDGVKETHFNSYENKTWVDKLSEGVVDWIGDIIENGIKEIKPLPSQTGNKDWGEYSHGREDRTKPFNEYLNNTLEMGVKIN